KDMAEEPELHQDDERDRAAERVAEALPQQDYGADRTAALLHAARSRARTPRVSGRTPRQRKNDSAACSTSIPVPSQEPAPPPRAAARKGVSLPYTMS